jgi:xylose isomerase
MGRNGKRRDSAKERVHAAFEFMEKMQIGFFCFHDADLAPRRDTLLETNRILDEVVAESSRR